jgi:hypothetical protein
MPVITSPSTARTSAPATRRSAAATAIVDDLDPFVAPAPSHQVGDAATRSTVVVRGLVLGTVVAQWAGGAVLEVTLSDGSGAICLAFLGRWSIAGVDPGRLLTAAGTVGCRQGRTVILDPRVWLHGRLAEVADA